MRSSSVRMAQFLAVSIALGALPATALAQTATSTTAATTTSTSAATTTSVATTTTTIHVDPPCAFQGGCLAQPPAAFVTGTSGEQRGVTLGTCWTLAPSGGQPTTACTSVVLVPPPALAVDKGTDLTLRFDPTLPASEITVVRRTSSDQPFDQPIAQQLSLPPGSGGRFGADFPEGTWDLEVTAQFPQGRVPYFFRIRVVATSQGPDAPSTRIAFTG